MGISSLTRYEIFTRNSQRRFNEKLGCSEDKSPFFCDFPRSDTQQEKAKVKGKGGVIGLTENPVALQRWMVAGLQMARLITKFESTFFPEADLDLNYRHHEESMSTQESFCRQTSRLIDTITEHRNQFLDDYAELVVPHTRDCVDDSLVSAIKKFETVGTEI